MPKQLTGKPIYELKIVNPNAIANYNGGNVVKAISEDLVAFVGKPMQGLVVKEAKAAKIVELVKADLLAKKVEQPVLRAGIVGKDIVFQVTDAKNAKYEQLDILVEGYVPLREKLKRQAAVVVNLDPGDRVIDAAARDMAANNNTRATTKSKVEYGKITGNAPIILLAHGNEDKTATGQIYGKDFAGRTPEQLVAMLVENPDPRRALSREYSGTIYLDGCFTAQGGAMENYTRQVWKLLKDRGLSKVSVKGNLGLAATTNRGDETITTSEAKAMAASLEASAQRAFDNATKRHSELRQKIWEEEFGASDTAGFLADDRVKRIIADADRISAAAQKKLTDELEKIPGYRVPNLVGTFGLRPLT